MKVQILSDDLLLVDELRKEEYLGVSTIQTLDEWNADILVLSDRKIHHNELPNHFLNHKKIIFYMLSNKNDLNLQKQIKTVCDSLDIKIINPRSTLNQIKQDIINVVFPEREPSEETNIVTFIAPISNIGLTSTVLSVGRSLARFTEKRIAVIGANAWDSGTSQLDYKGKYLHEIKTQLSNRTYELEHEGDFINDPFVKLFHRYEKSNQKGSLFYLAGNENTKLERVYKIEEIDYLIQLAKRKFDLVLIDGGCHFDNALIFQSLRHAEMKIVMVNQQKKALTKFNHYYESLLYPLGYDKSQFLLVINGLNEEGSLPKVKDIYEELDISFLQAIPMVEYIGIQSESIEQPIYEYFEDEYNNAIDSIAKGVANRSGITFIKDDLEKRASRKGLFRFSMKVGE